MTEFIAPDITNYIKQLETKKLDGLYDLFTNLEYSFVNFDDQEIPIDSWEIKDHDQNPIQDHILDLRRIAYYKDFMIIYCQIDRLTKFFERKIGKKLIEDYRYCLIIFTDSMNTEWHFVNIRWDEKNEKRNLFRRLVIDEYDKIYTANERLGLISLIDKMGSVREPEIAELMHIHDEAFDVEAVTAQFFQIYKSILTSIRNTFSDQSKTNEKECHEASQLLLNRLMFLYFIQKKNWLNNDRNFLFGLYNNYIKNKSIKSNFYSDYLKPLFFESFNNKHNYRKYPIPEEIKVNYSNMPYLNGGLFEETKLDLLDFLIPDQLMENIFTNLLEKYNFTIREDSPIDQEIAIDPEMLGKVYESLLLEEERGESGIFYTPRIEIDFMCKQSLFHYLKPKFQDHIEELIKILYEPDFIPKNSTWLNSLKNILENITVADPACGSGSFLVGMLNVLYDILRKIRFSLKLDINQFKILKRIIYTSLYGVDIKNWAIEVVKLRLWLRLIIKIKLQDLNNDEPILPNFFYKIRQGDSLIQRIGSDYFILPKNFVNKDIFEDKELKILDNLVEFKKNYYYHSKIKSIHEINDEITKISNELYKYLINIKITSYEKEIQKLKISQKSMIAYTDSKIRTKVKVKKKKNEKKVEYEQEIKLLKKFLSDLDQNTAESLFIWELDFIEVFKDGGFDFIIGNPPYIKSQEIAPPFIQNPTKKDKKKYKNKIGLMLTKKWGKKVKIKKSYNYLIYFYYLGLSILKNNGIFTFVTSNSWLDAQYGMPFKKFLLKNIKILEILETSEYKIFKQADVNVCISIFSLDRTLKIQNNLDNQTLFISVFTDILEICNIETFEEIYHSDQDFIMFPNLENPAIRIQKISQKKLYRLGAGIPTTLDLTFVDADYFGTCWGADYFRTPPELLDIISKNPEKYIKLGDILEIETYLNTGGADGFFFLRKNEELGNFLKISPKSELSVEFKIEKEFIKPFIESPKDLDPILVDKSVLTNYLFVLPKDFYERIEIVSSEVKKFIEWGEENGFNQVSGRRNKGKNWVFLPNQAYDNQHILLPCRINKNHKIYFNPNKYISHRFYRLSLKKKFEKTIKIKSLIYSLNSIITFIFMEIYRNPSLGGGVLDISKPLIENLLIPNPKLYDNYEFDAFLKSSSISKSIIQDFGYEIMNSIIIKNDDKINQERKLFDDILIEILEITSDELSKLKKILISMIKTRTQKKNN